MRNTYRNLATFGGFTICTQSGQNLLRHISGQFFIIFKNALLNKIGIALNHAELFDSRDLHLA